MVFFKLLLLIISALGIGYAAFELNNFCRYKIIYNRGVDFLKDGKYKQAEKSFKKVFEIDPKMFENLYNLALAHFYLESYKISLDYFTKAIELNPEEPDTYYNIGIIHYIQRRPKDTINYFNKVVDMSEKKDAETIFNMTLVYCELQDYDAAIQTTTRLIELQPQNIDYRMMLADIYEKLIAETGKIQAVDFAIKTYQEILDMDENHEGANIKIANCYAQKGDITSCKESCEKALKSNSKSVDALYMLGITHFSQQEYNEAIDLFKKVLDIRPTMKRTRINLAYAYAKINDNTNALETFAKYKSLANSKDITNEMEAFFEKLQPDTPTAPSQASS